MKTSVFFGSMMLLLAVCVFTAQNEASSPSVVGDAYTATLVSDMDNTAPQEVAIRAAIVRTAAKVVRHVIRNVHRTQRSYADDNNISVDQKMAMLSEAKL